MWWQNSLSFYVAQSMYSGQQFNAPPVKTWKYVGFLCSNILRCSNNIIPDEHDFHRLCSLVDLPVCGKINEHTVCVLVLRNFQMCLLVTMFLSNHCRCSFIASHTKRNPGKTRCIPAGKGMGSQQAFGIWYGHVCEQVDMIKVNEWETIPDFSNYCIALNICWCFLFWNSREAI